MDKFSNFLMSFSCEFWSIDHSYSVLEFSITTFNVPGDNALPTLITFSCWTHPWTCSRMFWNENKPLVLSLSFLLSMRPHIYKYLFHILHPEVWTSCQCRLTSTIWQHHPLDTRVVQVFHVSEFCSSKLFTNSLPSTFPVKKHLAWKKTRNPK